MIPDSFANLVYLKHLTISNDGREFEDVPNPHMNTIYYFNCTLLSKLTSLEEINMVHLNMHGIVDSSIGSLTNLKYLNLANNLLSNSIPDGSFWQNL